MDNTFKVRNLFAEQAIWENFKRGKRYNVNVAKNYLDDYQTNILEKTALKIIKPNEKEHEELIKLNGKYAYMFNLQAEKYRKEL